MTTNFIPCAKWVRRGVSKQKPEVIQFTKEELKGLISKAKNDIGPLDNTKNIKTNKKADLDNRTNNDQLSLENYDNEEEQDSLIGIGNLITLDDESMDEADNSDSDSDKEDEEIKPTDNLITVGHVSGDTSVLEVYVFNEADHDLYVHHDIVLPAVPLALEWLSGIPSHPDLGNLLAMGTMSPEITIWDLDVVNSLEPLVKLGEFSEKKKHQHRNHGHRDAVLDLAWNTELPHVLASGSVDRSVLLWDLSKGKAVTKFNDFKEKVQTLSWHPFEANILIAGACDGTVTLADCRISEVLTSITVPGEVEKLIWHPSRPFQALIGTSQGVLCCADCRSSKLQWKMKAHAKEVTGLVLAGSLANRHSNSATIVTCSSDQTVKVWSLMDSEPQLVYTKHTKLGDLHCLQVCPDNPSIVCVGGDARGNNFAVYNLFTEIQGTEEVTGDVEASDYDTELHDVV